ncbi:MAG TPA: hypothetical protein VI670_01845 [Thermoanaerobaculia bacterium]|jgi:hypothetical protein
MRRNLLALLPLLLCVPTAHAFLEDLCLPRNKNQPALNWCIQPNKLRKNPNRASVQQTLDFLTITDGRSMIHADSTYFIAQALGYRPDVAYWIVAYNENADYGIYKPIDQCGTEATTDNTGRRFISAAFNGFVRTNGNTDGPLDHYVVSYSPNGQGTDVHGAGGVQAVYPLHYPPPGQPDPYQLTLLNLRQWAMIPTNDPGLLCTVGLTASATTCVGDPVMIKGTIPLITASSKLGIPLKVPAGPKMLDSPMRGSDVTTYTPYTALESYLNNSIGTLYLAPAPAPKVPIQVARIGLYLHVLQDSSSHATYCGDDAPSVPGGRDPGTYMYRDSDGNIQLRFGTGCASSPHLAGHVQETGTGDAPLPLRDYVALNNTVDELIAFGNAVALKNGWIANPELLPPDVTGGKNAQGDSADTLKSVLVGTIVSGQPYSRAEVYQSGAVTLPLQQTATLDRLHAMNKALIDYGNKVKARSANPHKFFAFQTMPGNSADANDTSVCWH